MRKINLQLFADTAGVDAGAADQGPGPETPPKGKNGDGEGSGGKDPNQKKTFEDLMKDKDYQSEYDRHLKEALEAAKEKWTALMDDKVSEAEKLAKMTKEEKAQYFQQKKEKELADKEAAITRRELMAEAKNTLAEKKLPVGLAEVLNYADADSCSKSIEAVEKAFQEAVQAAVEEKLKGGTPPKKASSGGEEDLAKQVESLMMGI